MSEERRKEIWDDTLHFTVKGYDLIGKLLADRIGELEKQAERDSPKEELVREELRKRRVRKMRERERAMGEELQGQMEL